MKNVMAYARNAACQFTKAGKEFNQWKSNLADTAQDVTRAVRKTRRATEDFLDDVASAVRKQPWRSTGVAFGLGIGIGALACWFGKRK